MYNLHWYFFPSLTSQTLLVRVWLHQTILTPLSVSHGEVPQVMVESAKWILPEDGGG